MGPKLKPFTEADFSINPSTGVYDGHTVAVKQQELVDKDLEKYLLLELAILRMISHPGCLKFFGAYKVQNGINILTEYIEGGDLRRLLRDKGTPLGWKARVGIACGAARAISYLHDLEIIHRDIKTDNVLLAADLSPKLCDFGFARVWDKAKTMTMCGTDEFMAPEILFGMKYDEKVDIYSFGITLAEIMIRKRPGKTDAFLDRTPHNGFNVDHEELDRECKSVDAPQSLILLTKETCSSEGSDRPNAVDVVAWLDDLLREMPDDTISRPNLNADAIKDKLQEYLKQQKGEEEKGEELDEEEEKLEMKGQSEETKHIFQKAMTEQRGIRQGALTLENAGNGGDDQQTSSGGLFSACFGGQANVKKKNHGYQMSGWVTKRGGRIKTWKKRYMVVTAAGIMYFKSPDDEESQGAVEFSEMNPVAGVVANAVPTVMTGKAYSFGVHTEVRGLIIVASLMQTQARTYYIAAANAEERGKWIKAIAEGHKKYLETQNKGKRKSFNVGAHELQAQASRKGSYGGGAGLPKPPEKKA